MEQGRNLFPRTLPLHMQPTLCRITSTSSHDGKASVLGIDVDPLQGSKGRLGGILQQGRRGLSANLALCALLEASPAHRTLFLHLYNGQNHTLHWKLLQISDRSRCPSFLLSAYVQYLIRFCQELRTLTSLFYRLENQRSKRLKNMLEVT